MNKLTYFSGSKLMNKAEPATEAGSVRYASPRQIKMAGLPAGNNVPRSRRKTREINKAVKDVINVSMRNYYLAKIGDCIVAARNGLSNGRLDQQRLVSLQQQTKELLRAYNAHTEHKIMLAEIIPVELRPHWLGLKDGRLFVAASR